MHAAPFLERDRFEILGEPDAGIVDQNVQPAELPLGLLQPMRPIRFLGDIMLDGNRGAFACLVDRTRHFFRAFDVNIGDGDPRSFARQHPRRRLAKPLRTARDERDLSFYASCHVSLRSS